MIISDGSGPDPYYEKELKNVTGMLFEMGDILKYVQKAFGFT